MLLQTVALTSCRTTPRSSFRTLPQRPRPGAAPRESVSSVHHAAGSHLFADGCDPSVGSCRVFTVAGLRPTGSRLPDHSSAHVLSRRKPDGDVDNRNGAA